MDIDYVVKNVNIDDFVTVKVSGVSLTGDIYVESPFNGQEFSFPASCVFSHSGKLKVGDKVKEPINNIERVVGMIDWPYVYFVPRFPGNDCGAHNLESVETWKRV